MSSREASTKTVQSRREISVNGPYRRARRASVTPSARRGEQRGGRLDDLRVGRVHDRGVLRRVGQLVQHVAHRLEPRQLLHVRVDDRPRCVRRVGAAQHVVARHAVLGEALDRGLVGRAQLPLLQRVVAPPLEAPELLRLRDREPELEQPDARVDELRLEERRLLVELLDLGRRREPHHPLDPRAVVPGAVVEDDLAAGRQVRDVALEVPLAALEVGRLGKRDDPRAAGVRVLGEAPDRTALARRRRAPRTRSRRARPPP